MSDSVMLEKNSLLMENVKYVPMEQVSLSLKWIPLESVCLVLIQKLFAMEEQILDQDLGIGEAATPVQISSFA